MELEGDMAETRCACCPAGDGRFSEECLPVITVCVGDTRSQAGSLPIPRG